MNSIYLDDFEDYELNTIYNFIISQDGNGFEVFIPKENALGEHEQFFVFLDYYLAAYAGERLAELASSFSYYVPGANMVTNFKFELEVTDKEKLADVIYEIVQGYYDTGNANEEVSFYEKAAAFHDHAWENFEAACWGLVARAAEYIT